MRLLKLILNQQTRFWIKLNDIKILGACFSLWWKSKLTVNTWYFQEGIKVNHNPHHHWSILGPLRHFDDTRGRKIPSNNHKILFYLAWDKWASSKLHLCIKTTVYESNWIVIIAWALNKKPQKSRVNERNSWRRRHMLSEMWVSGRLEGNSKSLTEK